MFESKYSKVLTVVLIVIIIAIVVLLGLLGFDWYQKYFTEQEALAFTENYNQNDNISNEEENNENDNPENPGNEGETNPLDSIKLTGDTGSTSTTPTNQLPTFKGFGVLGTMTIPSIKFDYPILEKVSKSSIETSVAYLYGSGVNQVGNTVIVGHNYRNGLFFSNNKKLKEGDKIYITDNAKNRITYTVYNKFETSPDDISFYQRDTNGKPEITLSTCTDDSKARLIIFAKAD